MMKRLADTAYWVYAAGATGSLALSIIVMMKRFGWQNHLPTTNIGPFSNTEAALVLTALTLAFGLFFAMPLLRNKHTRQVELTDRAAELEVAVVTDPLTGLYNRRYFVDALNEYLTEFKKIGAPLALLTLDLDHFKNVNDTYGHDAGDIVLKEVAARLKKLTREHDIVARTGGEEFCIVAPFPEPVQIVPFAERICHLVSDMRINIGGVTLRPTISIGVVSTSEGIGDAKGLMKKSDERLYEAKRKGRNQVCA